MRRHPDAGQIGGRAFQRPRDVGQHEPVVGGLQPTLDPAPGGMRNPGPAGRIPNTPPAKQAPRPNPLPKLKTSAP
ncbi:hypothetical protein GCM10009828_006490 [Actinoplanes couchii]